LTSGAKELEEQAATHTPLVQMGLFPMGGGPSFVTQSLSVEQDTQVPSLMQFFPGEQSALEEQGVTQTKLTQEVC